MYKKIWYLLFFFFIQSDVIFADRYDLYFQRNLSIQYNSTCQQNNSLSLQQPFQSRAPFKINRSKSKKQQKAEFELYLDRTTDTYLQAGKDFFKGDIAHLKKIIKKAIEDKTINQPEVIHSLQHQAIAHLITTGQTDGGKVRPYKNHPWMQQHDLQGVSVHDQIMLNYFIARVSQKSNDTIVELVQAGLQSWDKAMQSRNQKEKITAENLYNKYYNLLQNQAQLKNIAYQAPFVQPVIIQKMLDDYTLQINNHQSNFVAGSLQDTQYFDRLKNRQKALLKSQQEPIKSSVNYINSITNNALGLLQGSYSNYGSFDNINCNQFQHCLTQEIVEIINASADMVVRNHYQPMITQFAQHNCNLAVSAQQLNQLSHVEQAAAITDMSHLFNLYCKYVLDDNYIDQKMHELGIGLATGTARALWVWGKFAGKLYNDPLKTIDKLADDCYGVARCLYCVAATLGNFMPFAYLDDLTLDMQDNLHALQSGDSLYSSSRMTVRTEHNMKVLQDGYFLALDTGQVVVASMMQKPFQENIADITQLTVDGMITSKITNSLLTLSQFVGGRLVQAGESIRHMIPSDILDSSISFMQTSSGELIAVAHATGENIGAVVASRAKAIAESSTPFFQYAPQAQVLADKIEKVTQVNKEEVAALQKSVQPYLRTDKIVDIERLKSIEGVEQIKKFKDFTKNFHPDEIAKLQPDEILYLNLCDWLEPQALEINAKIKDLGLTIVDPNNSKNIIHISEFDIFHSLLGEMAPGSVKQANSGGHLCIPQSYVATYVIDELRPYWNGFFDISKKHLRGLKNFEFKSSFPYGKNPEQCVGMIQNAIEGTIKNPQMIKFFEVSLAKNTTKFAIELESKFGEMFKLYIQDGKAKFFPLSPFGYK